MNHNTPVDVLRCLANDEFEGVRACVAKNPKASHGILKKLGKEKDIAICLEVASHLNTPIWTLIKLSWHRCFNVREEALKNLKTRGSRQFN